MRRVPTAIGNPLAEVVRKLQIPNLADKGLVDPGMGLYTRAKRGEIPILDVGFVDAVKNDKVEPVAALAGWFDGSRVLLSDGSTIEPDAVIVAAGYRRGLEPLVGHLAYLPTTGARSCTGRRPTPVRPVCTSSATRTRSAGCSARSPSTLGVSPRR